MGAYKVLDNLIENKLLSLHTAYLAKVISVNGNARTAKIQPLGLTKDVGQAATKQSVLTAVPYTQQVTNIAKGNIAVCVCCERDITEARKGRNVTPPTGRHSMSDSIIIGIL